MSGRSGRRPQRRPTTTTRRPSILVFTEGAKTEPLYVQHWHRAHRDRVLVTIAERHGVPLTLVEHAIETKRADLREAKRGRGDAHDQYWCVFDVDTHPHVPDAIDLARLNGIEVAVSNPCIELWFALHFAEQTAHISKRDAQRRCRELLQCEKHLTADALGRLVECFDDATRRARALDTKHAGDGSPPGNDPSSSVWRLIEAIRSAGL